MDEQMMQQIQQLVMAAMQGDQQASQQIQQIMQAAQQGDQQAAQLAQVIQQVAQQIQGQQAQAARFGAKLNYIKHLRGECPMGYEMQMFKKGGRLCKTCVKKNQPGGNIESSNNENPIDAYKKGCKTKKPQKAAYGAKTSKPMLQKCGGKSKKAKKYEDPSGPLPTAEEASVRYANNNGVNFEYVKNPNVLSQRAQYYRYDDLDHLVSREYIDGKNNSRLERFITPNRQDTIYVETPPHSLFPNPFVDMRYRVGQSIKEYPNNRIYSGEYDILKKRWNEAVAAAASKGGKK